MNPGMRMYMMTQAEEGGRMKADDGKYQERGIGQDENGYQLPYREPRPEFGERPENRYRGEDGRYREGQRRSSYGERKWEVSVEPKNARKMERPWMDPSESRMSRTNAYGGRMVDEYEDDYEDPTGRVIGFGEALRSRNHYGRSEKRQEMQRGSHDMHKQRFGQREAEEWVDGMMNEDPQRPQGGKWDVSFLKPMAIKVGIPDEGPEFWEFYAMVNAMYSDYCKVLKKYNADNPMCYAELAKAWMHDKDAVEDKTKTYYECIVLPAKDEGA